mmetsp:Transcript_31601/g.75391  ORF Transcript_31601/g.75391 Transcript_31601/m.75391 type:complete len:206 (-) Transcript_31601:359-976(-)
MGRKIQEPCLCPHKLFLMQVFAKRFLAFDLHHEVKLLICLVLRSAHHHLPAISFLLKDFLPVVEVEDLLAFFQAADLLQRFRRVRGRPSGGRLRGHSQSLAEAPASDSSAPSPAEAEAFGGSRARGAGGAHGARGAGGLVLGLGLLDPMGLLLGPLLLPLGRKQAYELRLRSWPKRCICLPLPVNSVCPGFAGNAHCGADLHLCV